jgi:hypothetical protein
MSWIIQDWAGNTLFKGKEFQTFDDAEAFLCEFFDDNGWDYDVERQEYEICEDTNNE